MDNSMVYLVDDDEDDIEVIREALFTYSYKGPVNTAKNGQMLLDNLNNPEENPNVIVMDLNMPIKNGFETLKEIKSTPSLKGIPVIILTASSNKHDEVKCFDLGCNYYYNKPNSIREYVPLIHIIKKFISKTNGNAD